MDLHFPKTAAGWPTALVAFLLLVWSNPCNAADDKAPAGQPAPPPAVKVNALIEKLYPDQSDLFRTLSATSPPLTLPHTPLTHPSSPPKYGKAVGSLIVYGRSKPLLPPVPALDSDGLTTGTIQPLTAASETTASLPTLSVDFLSTETLKRLSQDQHVTPNLLLSLPSGLNLSTLLETKAAPPTAAQPAEKAALPISIHRPQAPLPGKPPRAAAFKDPASEEPPTFIDINKAEARELMRVLKIDARRARLLVEFRDLYGPFKKPEDLTQVHGLSDKLVREWEDEDRLRF